MNFSFGNSLSIFGLLTFIALGNVQPAQGSLLTFIGTGDALGLSATADFQLMNNNTTLEIILTNTSTMPPSGGDQVLSSLNFKLGDGVLIAGGSVELFGDSLVVSNNGGNWTNANYGDNLNDEHGFANLGVGNSNGNLNTIFSGVTVADVNTMLNSAVTSHSNGGQNITTFSGHEGLPGGLDFGLVNLDKDNAFGNKLFIKNAIKLTLNLEDDGLIDGLNFLQNGAYVEFGSDYAYVGEVHEGEVPEPASLVVWSLGLGCCCCVRRKRKLQ